MQNEENEGQEYFKRIRNRGGHRSPVGTDRVDVEAVGADEGDRLLQVVVQDSILEVLVGHHGQSQGAHRVLAQVGELHLQGDGVAHAAVGNDVAVARLPVHQHIWEADLKA